MYAKLAEEDVEYGDIDGDGSVTSTDARLALQYYAGIDEGAEKYSRIAVPNTFKVPFIKSSNVEKVYGRVKVCGCFSHDFEELANPAEVVSFLNNRIAKDYSVSGKDSTCTPFRLRIVSKNNTVVYQNDCIVYYGECYNPGDLSCLKIRFPKWHCYF